MRTRNLLPFVFLGLAACASVQPAPVDFHINAGEDLAALEDAVKSARAGELALLALVEIDQAEVHARRAAEKRHATARRDDILRELGLAHAYLARAQAKFDVLAPAMADVFAERRAARAVGAHRLDETRKAFGELDRMIRRRYPNTEARRARLVRAYRVLEVTGVEARELGPARARLLEARRSGAKLVAPESLATAERAYFAAVDAMTVDPRAPGAFREPVATADRMSRALVAITQQARAVAGRSDEDLARELLLNQQRVEQLAQELAGVELNAEVKSRRLRDAVERNESHAVLERARQGLEQTDAEVFATGDRLLIRLKSGAANELRSVKGVIRDLNAHDVIVQGGSTTQASEIARSLAEVGPVARTIDPGATASTPVEVVITPEKVKR